ncbi:unnamed protein product [Dicrocoelium dendriticum]|nr:unnamed protein product [Dicrocoelium dendriticum]
MSAHKQPTTGVNWQVGQNQNASAALFICLASWADFPIQLGWNEPLQFRHVIPILRALPQLAEEQIRRCMIFGIVVVFFQARGQDLMSITNSKMTGTAVNH